MIKPINDSSEEYHSSPLMGTSTMVSGYNSKTGEINLAKVKAYIDGTTEISKSLQKIFDLGNVQHNVVLEQDLSQVVIVPKFEAVPDITKKAQVEAFKIAGSLAEMPDFKPIKGKTIKAQAEVFKAANPALYYINEKEFKLISGAFEVISSCAEASQMISNALFVEHSFYWPEKGIKTRPDIVGETDSGELYICNYKTIHDLQKYGSHIFSHSYDIRAMQEIEIIEQALCRKVKHYFFLFQEKTPPFSLKCVRISDIDFDIAFDEYKSLKNTVLIAMKNKYYPQPAFKIEESKVYRAPQKESF